MKNLLFALLITFALFASARAQFTGPTFHGTYQTAGGEGGGGTPSLFPTSGLLTHTSAQQFGASNNDPVSSWTDITGNGYHATSTTTEERPTYKTNQYNGFPGIEFDGIEDSLRFQSLDFLPSEHTVVAFVRANTGIGEDRRVIGSFGTNVGFFLYSTGSSLYFAGTGTNAASFTFGLDTPRKVVVTRNATATHVFVDGVDKSTNLAHNETIGRLILGSGNYTDYAKATFFEVLVYNRVLTAEEIADVNTQLDTNWNP